MPLTKFDIQKGYAVFQGSEMGVAPHAHHAYEILLNEDSYFDLKVDGLHLEGVQNVLIRPDVFHEFSGEIDYYAVILIDPEWVSMKHLFPFLEKSENKAFELDTYLKKEGKTAFTFLDELLQNLGQTQLPLDEMDGRVQHCLNYIDENLADGPIPLNKLAAQAFLSPSRFYHLFKTEIGISVRHYILWNRLKRTIESIFEGKSFTVAAHHGGFSDLAHFSKTFRNMFGSTPSTIFKN